ncbi:MAG TPA: hypothetical protein VJ801_00880 [Polyangia bacterium]|jgi:hypothetical protein|nr:hypothetical protein [Polyangia bacterium]
MGIHVLRRVADLGDRLVLAPERFDPRRHVEVVARRRLSDTVEIVAENVSARSCNSLGAVLILDTTHAYEGFVVSRHDPVPPTSMGSAKRRVQAGDVIISRLRPYLRQVALIDEALLRLVPGGNAVVVSTEFFVLRGRAGFDAAGLVPFLLSAPVQTALAAGQEGGHHPRFREELLQSLPVPDGVARNLGKTARQMRRLAAAVRSSLLASRSLVARVEAEIARHAPARDRRSVEDTPCRKPARSSMMSRR